MKGASSVLIYCGGTWKVFSCRNSVGCFSDGASGEDKPICGWKEFRAWSQFTLYFAIYSAFV